MTALFILCLALVSVAQAETWRGVEIAPENRCSPYDRAALEKILTDCQWRN